MSRAAFGAAMAAALAAALALRLWDPAARPLHHDEANQAVRFGHLLETGEYRYDPHDHHGPTLYYLTLPGAWARGQQTLAALDERTIRLVPALFGSALLLLFVPLSRSLGRAAIAAAALLAALSPALTYYSRFYIQEPVFAFFALGFLIAVGEYARRPRTFMALAAGLLAGLTLATKETALIVLPAAGVAAAIARRLTAGEAAAIAADRAARLQHAAAAAAGAAVPIVLFYTAFFRHPSAVLDAAGAFSIYLERGVEPGPHVQPWHFYLRTLAWSSSGGLTWTEGFVLALALAGAARALSLRRSAFWPLCVAVYAVGTMAAFSAIPYKTPWNLLAPYTAIVVLAGVGAAWLIQRPRGRALRAVLAVVLALGGAHLAAQSVRASVRYAADERNPYVYAHTTPDYLRLVRRVHELAAVHADGRDILVKVIAPPHEQWPFPWYARNLRRVGYWTHAAEAGRLDGTPVILAAPDTMPEVEAAVGEHYVTEFYGLRPGVLVALYIEPALWERFLAARQP